MNKDSKITLLTGNTMPIFGLGTWQLANTTENVLYALELGYRLIDTSSDYGTQPGVGEGIKKAIEKNIVSRKDIYLVTKVEENDDSFERVKSNLAELGLEYADLMLIHRPPEVGAGEELWAGLIRAKKEGLTKDIGVSNYSSSQIEKLIEASYEIPVVNQIEWSPFGYSKEMWRYCKEKRIIIQAYSPLTRREKSNDDNTLLKIAEKYNKKPQQILIRWNLQLGTVPLPKSDEKNHLKENLDVFDFEIIEKDMQILNSLNEEFSSLGSLPYV